MCYYTRVPYFRKLPSALDRTRFGASCSEHRFLAGPGWLRQCLRHCLRSCADDGNMSGDAWIRACLCESACRNLKPKQSQNRNPKLAQSRSALSGALKIEGPKYDMNPEYSGPLYKRPLRKYPGFQKNQTLYRTFSTSPKP